MIEEIQGRQRGSHNISVLDFAHENSTILAIVEGWSNSVLLKATLANRKFFGGSRVKKYGSDLQSEIFAVFLS